MRKLREAQVFVKRVVLAAITAAPLNSELSSSLGWRRSFDLGRPLLTSLRRRAGTCRTKACQPREWVGRDERFWLRQAALVPQAMLVSKSDGMVMPAASFTSVSRRTSVGFS
jgi:hypothetical protein